MRQRRNLRTDGTRGTPNKRAERTHRSNDRHVGEEKVTRDNARDLEIDPKEEEKRRRGETRRTIAASGRNSLLGRSRFGRRDIEGLTTLAATCAERNEDPYGNGQATDGNMVSAKTRTKRTAETRKVVGKKPKQGGKGEKRQFFTLQRNWWHRGSRTG